MSEKTKLQRLYEAIPSFTCKPGCTACCGPVPFSREEMAAAQKHGHDHPVAVAPLTSSCGFAQKGQCAIYADRPFVCRLFGAVKDPLLACPFGCGPKKSLTAQQGEILTAKYHRIFEKDPQAAARVHALIGEVNRLRSTVTSVPGNPPGSSDQH